MAGVESLQCVSGTKFLARWRVKNFSLFGVEQNQSEKSLTFEVPFLENSQWFLKLLFKLPEENNIMCFLWRNDEGPEYVKVFYSISMGSSWVAERQTFARNTSCFNPGLINQRKFQEDVCRNQSKDVLLIECCLSPDTSEEVPRPVSPFPVGIEMVTVIPTETRSLFFKIPKFSKLAEDYAIEFSVNSARCDSVTPRLLCRLWLDDQQTLKVLVRNPSDSRNPRPFTLKCNVNLLDAFRDRHLLYNGNTIINYEEEPSFKTMKFSLAMSKNQLMDKKDLYLPGDELLLHWEFACSFNAKNVTFTESTLFAEPPDLQANRDPDWGIYIDRKYNEHRFFFRLLALLVVVFSVLPHLLFDDTP